MPCLSEYRNGKIFTKTKLTETYLRRDERYVHHRANSLNPP